MKAKCVGCLRIFEAPNTMGLLTGVFPDYPAGICPNRHKGVNDEEALQALQEGERLQQGRRTMVTMAQEPSPA